MNRVTLMGNLGKDAEVRRLENGTAVAKFSIATTESWKDTNGEWQDATEWHDIIVWRKLAETAENLKKGASVYIEGKLTHRKYTDKNGVERYATEVMASVLKELVRPPKSETNFPSEPPPQKVYESTPQKADSPVAAPIPSQIADASIPFPTSEDGLPF